jgi:Skp family chaperone for outer membrane proteins
LKTIITLAVLFALSLSGACAAVTSPAPAASIGVVDIDRLMQESDKAKRSNTELQAMQKELEAGLKVIATNRLLTDKELDELGTLKAKATPVAAEQSRITALEDLNKQREGKLKALQTVQNPSSDEKRDLTELQGYAIGSGKMIEQDQKDAIKKINARNAVLTEEIYKDIKTAVEVVSKESNISVVLNKNAVIQGGVDLTDKTLKKLNAK